MNRLLSRPTFHDPECHRKSHIFFNLVWGFIIIFTCLALVDSIILPKNIFRWLSFFTIFSVASFYLLILNNKGQTRFASYLLINLFTILIFSLAFTSGGMKSASIQFLPIVVLITGILLGWKEARIIGLVAITGGLGLVLMEHSGMLPVSLVAHNSMSLWITSILGISSLSLLLYTTITTLNKALEKANEELSQRSISESRIKLISNNITSSMIYQVLILPDGKKKFTYLSESVQKLYGISPEDAMANERLIYDRVYEEDLSEFLKAGEEAQKTLSIFKAEARIKDPSGGIRWSSFVSTPRILEDKSICFDGIEFVITDRKKTELALIESEEKYRFLMENMNEVVMMVDNDDKVLFVNKKFTEKLGYTPDEIIGEIGYKKLLDPNDHSTIIEENKKRIQRKISQYELCFIGKNGEKIDFLINGAPILDADGKTLGSIGTMTDITERKLAENALKESQERYKRLIEAFPDIILVTDLKGNILFGNEPLEKITGITPDDYDNPNRTAHIHPEDARMVSDTILKLLNGNESCTGIIENRFIDTLGNLHWFSGRIAKLEINHQIVLQTISRDITEKKIIEKELEKHQNQLELLVKERTEELNATIEELNATNEELFNQKEELQSVLTSLHNAQNQLIQSEKMASLGILSAGVAHEINNPLNFIHGGIWALESYFSDHLQEHIKKVSPLFNAINEGVRRASDIVSSLSHYSRHDDLPKVECDIHSIIENCLTMLHNQLKNKVEVNKIFTTEFHILYGNEGKLHQAFLNIISNAEQSIKYQGTIDITTSIANNALTISIKDTGIGIDQLHLKKIFDPFFTTKETGKGTGLGLSITYNIIMEHDGTILFESEPDNGTMAIITLPLIKKINP